MMVVDSLAYSLILYWMVRVGGPGVGGRWGSADGFGGGRGGGSADGSGGLVGFSGMEGSCRTASGRVQASQGVR